MEMDDGALGPYLLELDHEESKEEHYAHKADEAGEDYADNHAKNPADVLVDLLKPSKGAGHDYYDQGPCKECGGFAKSVLVKLLLMPEPIEVPKQWDNKTPSICKPQSLVEWEKQKKTKQGPTKGQTV